MGVVIRVRRVATSAVVLTGCCFWVGRNWVRVNL